MAEINVYEENTMTDYFKNKLHFYTHIGLKKNKDGILKKQFNGLPIGWQNFTMKDCNKYNKTRQQDNTAFGLLTGEKNNLFVIDFDKPEIYDKYKEKYNILTKCFTVKTTKGYHCYFAYKNGLTNNNSKEQLNGVDLLTNNNFVVGPNSQVDGEVAYKIYYTGKPNLDCPNELINELRNEFGNKKESKNIKIKIEKNSIMKETPVFKKLSDENKNKVVELIDVRFLDNRNDWRNICWAMDYEGFDREYIRHISMKSSKYDNEGFDNIFKNFSNNGSHRMGTLNYYARMSNESEYIKVMGYTDNKFNKFFNDLTDDGFADLIFENIGNDFVYQDEIIYVYYKNSWHENHKNLCKSVISTFLQTTLNKMLSILSNDKVNAEDDKQEIFEKRIQTILMALKKVKTVSSKNNILDAFIIKLSERLDKVEFDNYPYYICFNNGIYDLKHKEFIPKQKEFYLTMSTNFDYNPDEDVKNIQIIETLIEQIFPIEDERILYCCLLMRSFIGINNDKFVIANGCGGNGKSVLHSLTYLTQGDYGYILPSVVLSKEIKDGPNPEIAGIHKKRFTMAEEPDEKVGISNSTMKQLSGGGNGLRARKCNSNSTLIHLVCSLFINCNDIPKLQGSVKDADARRILDILFRSVFIDDPDKAFCDYAYKKNINWTDNKFLDNYKNAYFIYLTRYLDIINTDGFTFDNITPQIIKDRTKQYLSDCDAISSWFFDNYETSNDNTDIIQIKNLYEDFKLGEGFINMNKKEKRLYTKKYFLEKVATNIMLRKFYKEREQRKEIREKYNVKEMRNVLIGFIPKQDDIQDNTEEFIL